MQQYRAVRDISYLSVRENVVNHFENRMRKKVSLCFKHKNMKPTDFLGTVIVPVKTKAAITSHSHSLSIRSPDDRSLSRAFS